MIKRYLKVALFGLICWGVPFLVSVLIYPLRESQRPLFESIMPVVVAISAITLSIIYFAKVEDGFLRAGILIGIAWLIISIGLDLLLFMHGPMKMTLADYIKDIGITYLIIPAVAFGQGFIAQRAA